VGIAETAIAHVAAARMRELATVLELIARDSAIGDRIADELVHGWSHYAALVTGAEPPPTAERSARSQVLWRAWNEKLRGKTMSRRGEVEQAGYITLVA
jgi:hypothetical protein